MNTAGSCKHSSTMAQDGRAASGSSSRTSWARAPSRKCVCTGGSISSDWFNSCRHPPRRRLQVAPCPAQAIRTTPTDRTTRYPEASNSRNHEERDPSPATGSPAGRQQRSERGGTGVCTVDECSSPSAILQPAISATIPARKRCSATERAAVESLDIPRRQSL